MVLRPPTVGAVVTIWLSRFSCSCSVCAPRMSGAPGDLTSISSATVAVSTRDILLTRKARYRTGCGVVNEYDTRGITRVDPSTGAAAAAAGENGSRIPDDTT